MEFESVENRSTQALENIEPNRNIYTKDKQKIVNDYGFNKDRENIDGMNEYIQRNQPRFYESFELTDFIGSGSTGVVYKGKSKNKDNKQFYAFKFCIQNNKSSRKSINRYREIYNQKQLHHKYIVQIFAFYKINDTDFFSVSELGTYGNLDYFLHYFLKKRILSETFINYITKPILEGLNYMHKKHFLHLDIKKGNIVLNAEMNIKLIDFSSTFCFKDYQPNDLIIFPMIGTGRYMPPEVLNKTKMEVKYGGKIDVYALGVTLYNLAFGIYPYGLSNIKADDYTKMAEHLNTANLEFPRNIEISRKFENFLRKTLEKDYIKRYSIKDALEDPWVKGWDIISEEKENTGILENFIIKLISDDISKFNQYIK